LHFAIVIVLQAGRGLINEVLEIFPQPHDVSAAGPQDLPDLGSVDNGQQKVFDRHEFMTRLAGRLECLVEADFKFTA
jgi:hypothetical protein